MPPPKVYRFEPRPNENWEQYIGRVCVYFKLSVHERITIVNEFLSYTKDGVDQYCAGYMVLKESGLRQKMIDEVDKLRPERRKEYNV